jgi:hypothetical protein
MSFAGGSGFSGAAVGVSGVSKSANIFGWLQAIYGARQSAVKALSLADSGAAACLVTTASLTFSLRIARVIVA